MRQFGDLEALVMDRMWAWEGSATVREVLNDLARDRKLAYTTVMTVMDHLHRKGVLAREVDGRAYRYTPVRTKDDYTAELIADVLADSGDRTAPLLRFVEHMTPQEVALLRASLDGIKITGEQPGDRRGRDGTGNRGEPGGHR